MGQITLSQQYDAENDLTMVFVVGRIESEEDCRQWYELHLAAISTYTSYAYWVGVLHMFSVGDGMFKNWARYTALFAEHFNGVAVVVGFDTAIASDAHLSPMARDFLADDIPEAIARIQTIRASKNPEPRKPGGSLGADTQRPDRSMITVRREYDAEHDVALVFVVGRVVTEEDCREWLAQHIEIAALEDRFAYWVGVMDMFSVDPSIRDTWMRYVAEFTNEYFWGVGVIVGYGAALAAFVPAEWTAPDVATAIQRLVDFRAKHGRSPPPPKRSTLAKKYGIKSTV